MCLCMCVCVIARVRLFVCVHATWESKGDEGGLCLQGRLLGGLLGTGRMGVWEGWMECERGLWV